MSSFDADMLMQTEVAEPMETDYTPIIPEAEYNGIIFKVVARTWTNDDDKEIPILNLTWEILDDELRASMDMDTVTVQQSIFLDVEEDGRLLFGKNKNIWLGRVRAAVGQDNAGPWDPRWLDPECSRWLLFRYQRRCRPRA